MRTLYIDAESYSEASLPDVGSLIYTQDPSTFVRMWTVYDPRSPRGVAVTGCNDLETAVRHVLRAGGTPTVTKPIRLVHWGAFDRHLAQAMAKRYAPESCFAREPRLRKDTPQGVWFGDLFVLVDLRQLSLQVGGPAELAAAAEWVGASSKLEGKAGIALWSTPDPATGRPRDPADHPDEWRRFVRYGVRDAEVLHPIAAYLGSVANAPLNAPHWRVVERMNMRGFPVDRPAVKAAQAVLERLEPGLVRECERLSGLRPTQTQKLKAFFGTPNTQRPTLEEYLTRRDITPAQRRVAGIRLETAGATRHKLGPMLRHSTPEDPRCRYQFTYFGAWTTRLTAQATQPQNFYRGRPSERFFDDLGLWPEPSDRDWFEDVKRNIRGFVKAPKGKTFVAADFAQIELRVMAWLADERWLLDDLRAGVDVYKKTAGVIYGIEDPLNAIGDEDPERQFGKTVELASQFQLSGIGHDGDGGLWARARGEGIDISKARAEHAIEAYRRTHPAIVRYWDDMNAAAIKCAVGPVGNQQRVRHVYFERTRDDLMRLVRPSGMAQCFWQPRVQIGRFDKLQLTYVGRNKAGQMKRTGTYGGKLAQGSVQGTAADLLLEGMRTAERAGYPPIMSIHDEIVTEIDDDGLDHVDALCEIFTSQLPTWASEIPVKAEGWQGRRFRK